MSTDRMNEMKKRIFHNTCVNLQYLDIDFRSPNLGDFFQFGNVLWGGFVRLSGKGNLWDLRVHHWRGVDSIEAYSILCHEIAHVLLGHLGGIYLTQAHNPKEKKTITRDR